MSLHVHAARLTLTWRFQAPGQGEASAQLILFAKLAQSANTPNSFRQKTPIVSESRPEGEKDDTEEQRQSSRNKKPV